MEQLTNEAKAYLKGYNDAVKDSVQMINACSESLNGMLKMAEERFKAAGINVEDLFKTEG